ncbi:MAG: type II toxin-antitoxin system VapC family toxin [Candidatus Nezhaarchaeales archaeon]
MIVLDASALAMVLLREEGWERVGLSTNTAIPDLAILETMNAIWKAIITERIERNDAMERLKALKLILKGIRVLNSGDFLERTLEIAIEEKITVYDALYIAIAETLSAKLVTSDLKQFEIAKKYVRAEMV